MPPTKVYFYQDTDGRSSVVDWLDELRATDEDAYAKCLAVITRLRESGHELRRPTADLLRDGIYELRARKGHVNYRLLYFFHGRTASRRSVKFRRPTSQGHCSASGSLRSILSATHIRRRNETVKAARKKRTIRDAEAILDRLTGKDPKLRARIEEATLNVRVAEMIYQAREAAGLTQTALAKLVGTTQSVISKLEDADYEGHSLSMLKRIGDALHQRLELRFVPEDSVR